MFNKLKPRINTDRMSLKYEKITEDIIGAAYEVYNVLGYGFLEKVYQKALQVELLQRVNKATDSH